MKSKRMISILLGIMLLFVTETTCFVSVADDGEKILKEFNQDDYITEVVNENNSITKTLVRNEGGISPASNSEVDNLRIINTVRATLLELGMLEEEIEGLSVDELYHYYTSPYISVTKSFVVERSDGSIEYISEADMNAHLAVAGKKEETEKTNKNGIPTRSEPESYMTITHTVSADSTSLGKYYFSTSGLWNTMPFWRLNDSIGSCAQNLAVDDDTRGGYYSYYVETVSNSYVNSSHPVYNITTYGNAINGNWYGSVGIFSLPLDSSLGGTTVTCSFLFATFHYYGYVNLPTLPSYFNSVGSYDHKELAIVSDGISIGVGVGDGFSASIGLTFIFGHTRRSEEVLIYHNGN